MGLDVGEIGMGADLSLDLRYFAAKAVRQARDAPASDVDACIRRLEEERGKIEMFRRELPLCARLLAEVIDVMKGEAGKKTKSDRKVVAAAEEDGAAGDKSKWMSTAQLWTGDSGREDAESEKQDKGRSSPEAMSRGGGGGGGFLPFKAVGSGAPAFAPLCLRVEDKAADAGMPDLSLLSPPASKSAPAAAGAAEESRRQVVGFAQAAARAVAMTPSAPSLSLQSQSQQTAQQQQQQARKARRTWSPELHRQFVAALSQLGGAQVATPKQIRELMKVDGLTNDEVKSHLQKYRLHNRRAPGSAAVSPPIVLVGGLWIPQEQSSSQSGSPQGPLHFSTSGIAVSSAATVSCEEEDGRSESYGWK
ncbi:Myb family transcription factor EFM [Dichanthelium oligosanthes]|uniref:Myb family transcription factor EFM n=1 Tax=Dichanthelium oligosanthes TaxID=888268 RepID=A0A1E5UUC5_9POAL|nr:Myb family transcription factor EFM [Dichanthelium oligosanthes]